MSAELTALFVLLGAVLLVSGGLTVLLLWGATHPAGNLKAGLKAQWYRLFQDADSKSSTEEVAEAYEANGDTFGYERARLREDIGPCIVAGSDLDWADRQDIAKVNARLAAILAVDKELAGLSGLDLSAYYVLPEGER